MSFSKYIRTLEGNSVGCYNLRDLKYNSRYDTYYMWVVYAGSESWDDYSNMCTWLDMDDSLTELGYERIFSKNCNTTNLEGHPLLLAIIKELESRK